MLDVTTTLEDVLYSPIDPYDAGMLSVSEVHTIAWEKSGNPDGIPVLVIHGGPGGGGQPAYRQYFDPKTYNIIQFDQRGCGKSTPYAELIENNTQASVRDIEQLRQLFGYRALACFWWLMGFHSCLGLCPRASPTRP